MEASGNKHIEELWTVANDYCLFLENCKEYSAAELNEYLRKVTPLLYIKGSLLPILEFDDDVIVERFVSEEHYENIFMAVLEKYQSYNKDFWDDTESTPEYVAEGVADVYQDLKDFSILLRKPLSADKQNAIAAVAESFQPHWGTRLAELLPILHSVYAQSESTDTDEDISSI